MTSRKVRAVAAGGIVLGVGAAVTLASWNDSEFAEGVFGTSTFVLESSTNGTDYVSTENGSPATLEFDAAEAMSPGSTAYAPFFIRLNEDSTVSGVIENVSLTAASGGNTSHLSWSLFHIAASATCDGTVEGTPLASGNSLSETAQTAEIPLVVGADGAAGTAVQFCLRVTTGSGASQGDSGTSATWQFAAVSDE